MRKEIKWRSIRPRGVLHAFTWFDFAYLRSMYSHSPERLAEIAKFKGRGQWAGISMCGRKTVTIGNAGRRCIFCRWLLLPRPGSRDPQGRNVDAPREIRLTAEAMLA